MDIHECLTSGKQIHPSINEICFNHYKLNRINNRKDLDNINQEIKIKIEYNYKNYFIYPYRTKNYDF